MTAPTITTIRSGVQFTPAAAASFRRAEHGWGRRIDVNSTYRDWDLQMSWYRAWNAYVAGDAPHPGHSRAIHPNLSAHCKGLGLDSDDWTRPGFIKLMAEHGWIRTAANDPTERHHFEYQSWRDQHVGELASGNITPIIEPETECDMTKLYNTTKADSAGRRHALAGEFSFQELSSTAANEEWNARDGEVFGVDQTTWDRIKVRTVARRKEAGIGGVVAAPIDYAKLAAEVAKLIPAATGAPTAAENAAEVIRQMKLPGN